MEALVIEAARSRLTGLLRPCPSGYCDGFLSEFEVESTTPLKAFLLCPLCESRLRVHENKEG